MSAGIVANSNGSFALLGISSRYQGVFFPRKGRVFKTVNFFETVKSESFQNSLWKLTQNSRSFWFAHRLPVFFCESKAKCNVVLDCKESYDNREWGRYYDIFTEDNAVIVHYQKKNDFRENAGEEYSFWLAFYGADFKVFKEWFRQEFAFDAERNSRPFSRHVLRAFSAKGSFVCSFGSSKWEALKLAKSSWKQKRELAREAKSFALKNAESVKSGPAKHALHSLVSMCCGQGLYAGLPWFHQRWARDELISCNALPKTQKALVKSILFYWLDKIKCWKLAGTLTSSIADSWLFPRFADCWSFFNETERESILSALNSYSKSVEVKLKDGLLYAAPNETWMDSLSREGPRIEVQALALASLKFAKRKKLELMLKKKVKDQFWNGTYLKDSPKDSTIRPNIFIAAYVYPGLLSKKEWMSCFDYVLPKLWLSWGGFSTIDKSDSRFVAKHTGEDSASYHNGDSWYWVNNLAAIVLSRIDKRKYKKYIDAVFWASTREIMEMGAMGHHAEVSSASKQTSSGCLAQAWSAAMYVELCRELGK